MSDPPRSATESNGQQAIESLAQAPPPIPESGIQTRRSLVIAVSYFVVQVVLGAAVGVVVGMYYGVTRGAMTREVIADMQRVVALPAAMISLVGSGLVVFGMTRRTLSGPIRGGALRSIGWSAARRERVLTAVLAGLVLAAFYIFVLGRLFPPRPGQKFGPIVEALASGGWQRHLWAVIALCIAPPIEEFLFRGVLWSGLLCSMKTVLAAVAVTLLFVIAHIFEIRSYWPAWVMISALGLAAVYMRIRGESLVPPVALHASYNACLVAAVYLGAA